MALILLVRDVLGVTLLASIRKTVVIGGWTVKKNEGMQTEPLIPVSALCDN